MPSRRTEAKKVFISHISEEASVASALRSWIARAVGSERVFASTHDVALGQQWLAQINKALTSADALVVLCSPRSVDRPWVNFEAGGGWGKSLPVVPVCHSGMTRERLPDPLRMFQGVDLDRESACELLIGRLAELLEAEPEALDYSAMLRETETAISEAKRANPYGVRPTSPPSEGRPGILIDVSHQQSKWRPGAIFDLPNEGLTSLLKLDARTMPEIRLLDDSRGLWLSDLEPWQGIILGTPWRATIQPEAQEQLIGWVRQGGRLLLLGFELGDRHHGANLNAIAGEFGLHFNSDIVAPASWTRGKPYDEMVNLDAEVANSHPVIEGVRRLKAANLQTLTVEPGSTELIRVGPNKIARPARTAVDYTEDGMRTPREDFELIEEASWIPVAAEAPLGLTERGRVLALGTWDLIGSRGNYIEDSDNIRFLTNLLAWLAGRT